MVPGLVCDVRYADGRVRSSMSPCTASYVCFIRTRTLLTMKSFSFHLDVNMTRYQRSTCHRVAISILHLCITMFLIPNCLGDIHGRLDVSITPRTFSRNRSGAAVKKIKLRLLPVSRRKATYCISIC